MTLHVLIPNCDLLYVRLIKVTFVLSFAWYFVLLWSFEVFNSSLAVAAPRESKEKRQGKQLRWPVETDRLLNLSIFSHFYALLANQPRADKRKIVFRGLCQKSSQPHGSSVLKSRREFSTSLQNRHPQRISTKTVDHNADIKF